MSNIVPLEHWRKPYPSVRPRNPVRKGNSCDVPSRAIAKAALPSMR